MTGSLLLDTGLVLVLLAYAVGGYRMGIVRGAFSLAGLIGGALLGLWLMPTLISSFVTQRDTRLSTPLVLVGVLVLVLIGQAVGAAIGHRLRSALRGRTVGYLDGALGAIAQVIVVSLVVWFVAATARPAVSPSLSAAISGSRVLRAVDAAVPDDAGRYLDGLRSLLDEHGFPRVFPGVTAEPIEPASPPDAALAAAPAIRAVSGSVVKIRGNASCGRGQEGSGWVLAPGRVVTNAHVVAGVFEPGVQILGQGRSYAAKVVHFNAARDVAVLDVPGLPAPAMRQGAALGAGDSAVVAGFPLDGPYAIVPARVRAVISPTGEDIYGRSAVTRQVYSLYTTVEPGNSGGPVIAPDGAVVGVVFARSMDDRSTGYALTLSGIADDLRAGLTADQALSTRCAA